MMNKLFPYLIFFVLLSSCVVSKKKYDDVNSKKSALEVDKHEAEEEVKVMTVENQRLNKQLMGANAAIDSLAKDKLLMGQRYQEMTQNYDMLTQASKADAQRLSKQMKNLSNLKIELEDKNQTLKAERVKIDSLENGLKKREERIQELEELINEQEEKVARIKNTISKALLSFNDDELTVNLKDGKVYISMSEKLLFKSGSYSIDKKGIDALAKLGKSLKGNSTFDVVVEGHTDDVPFKGKGVIKDNWDLSVLRATAIVRTLVNSGVPPAIISASGRSKYLPKVKGKDAASRAKNRRTEIIVAPRLNDLYQIIGK